MEALVRTRPSLGQHDLHAALTEALRSRDRVVTHDCADESVFFWAHLEDWFTDAEALSIVKHVREDDGVEAFRQLNCRYDPVTALTKSRRLKAIRRRTPMFQTFSPASTTCSCATARITRPRL